MPRPRERSRERSADSGELLTGDHVSNVFPKATNNLGLEDWVLERHVAYDIGTRSLLNHLSEYLDAPAVLAGYSRLLVDLNRSLEDPSAIPKFVDSIVIPGNLSLIGSRRRCGYTLSTPLTGKR